MLRSAKLFAAKNEGFTLVELVIVIALLSILVVGTLSLINPSAELQKALDSKRKTDLSHVQKALELYYHDNGAYPNTLNLGSSWQPYSLKLPNDPRPPKKYTYKSTGQVYYLYASLDRGDKDPQACNNGNTCLNAVGLDCGGICNYGVSSPNVTP